MKRLVFLICCLLFAVACKKNEEPQPDKYLSSIKFTDGSSFNVTYNLFYDTNRKLERISLKGFTGGGNVNTHYIMQYKTGKLDSIICFDSISNTRFDAVGASWTGEKMTFFWRSTFTYDVQGRITNTSTVSGNTFRVLFLTDSSLNYFDEVGVNPEYLSWVTYRAANIKNPFRIKNNEALFPINNYVFNFINHTCKDAGFDLAESKSTLYKPDGSINYVSFNTYEGNVNNYPTKQTISYSTVPNTRVLEFTYY